LKHKGVYNFWSEMQKVTKHKINRLAGMVVKTATVDESLRD